MEINKIYKLANKNISVTINMMDQAEINACILEQLEEQLFITLAFIGATIERLNKDILGFELIQAFKYVWNYSKHGKSVYTYTKIDETPTFSSNLYFGDKHFQFNSNLFAWSDMPFDKNESSLKQYKAYCKLLRSQHIPNTLRDLQVIFEKFTQ